MNSGAGASELRGVAKVAEFVSVTGQERRSARERELAGRSLPPVRKVAGWRTPYSAATHLEALAHE